MISYFVSTVLIIVYKLCRLGAAFSTNAGLFAPKSNESKSFALNMFRGSINAEQVFPYPDVLTTEQRETLEMLVPATTKFFEECNDPARNDAEERIPEETMQGLREMGAFGLQVHSTAMCERVSSNNAGWKSQLMRSDLLTCLYTFCRFQQSWVD